MAMDEARLIERLLRIEALFAGATTPGERDAAEQAKERILKRLAESEVEDPPVEYRFTMADRWSRKVFVALLRRYGIRPYRYYRQRHTTVMARVSKRFVDETLWPEFRQIADTLESYLSEVTERVISQVLHQDSSEAEVVSDTKQLPPVGAAPNPRPSGSTPDTTKDAAKTAATTTRVASTAPNQAAVESEKTASESSGGTTSGAAQGPNSGSGGKKKRRKKKKRRR